VLLDDRDRVLSSLKRYRTRFRVGADTVPGSVIGALFTPARLRRNGHARRLLQETLSLAANEGDAVALLFSDVGTGFYEPCGFRAVPAVESFGRLPRRRSLTAPGGWRSLVMRREHEPLVAAARGASAAKYRLVIERDGPLWSFLKTRTREFFRRYDADDVRPDCRIVMAEGRFVGYVVSVEGNGEWSVREVGAIDGSADTEADILRVVGSDMVGRGARRVHGWIPEEVGGRIPEWRWIHARRRRAIPMIASLGGGLDVDRLVEPGATDLTFLDQF
jgi:hypothetical protein